MNFSSKDPDEVEYFGFDFTPRLASGELLLAAVFAIEVQTGSDPAAAAMLLDAATIDGGSVRQRLAMGVAGVRYRVSARVTTSTGQVLAEAGTLLVREID